MLSLHDVTKNYGGLRSLDTVNLHAKQGLATGLIGPNGAGKTTMINCISGLDHPTSGSIIFDNHHIERTPPHVITGYGLARTYQNIRLFGDMTVLENLIVAQHSDGHATLLDSLFLMPRHFKEYRKHLEHAMLLLERFDLVGVKDDRAGSLPYGDQRRLEMARAVATNPKMILLDEPTAGMNPIETRELGDQILKMKEDGLTILVVEHDMALIAQVCDIIYVLNFGKIIAHGTVEAIQQNEEVIEAYLGRED